MPKLALLEGETPLMDVLRSVQAGTADGGLGDEETEKGASHIDIFFNPTR